MRLFIAYSAKVFLCCCSEIIDASLNDVPVQTNEETTENGIPPELAKVMNAV